MVDQERVREMTKLAAYEKHEGKRCRLVTRYFRSDFVVRELLKGFLYGTAAFGIILLMWGVCHLEELIGNLDSIDLIQLGTAVLIRYVMFLIVYLVAVDIYANVYNAEGKKRTKRYYRHLKRLGRMYEDHEGHSTPLRH